MEFTYEELREEEKRNIEIIESCAKLKDEIDQNIKNISSIIDMIKKQGELDKQIEEVNEQIAAVDNNNNNNNMAKEILSEKKERLSQLKTLLLLNQNKNESDIQMLEREIKQFEQQKKEIEVEQQKSVKKLENIVEICNEHIAELNEDRTVQHQKTEVIGEITEKYAELEEELESFKIYDGFLTKKQQQRIKEIENEKEALEKQMVNALPDLRQEIVNKTKKTQLDLLLGVAQIQEGKSLDRKNTIINSYEKVAQETTKYLESLKGYNEKAENKTENSQKDNKLEEANIKKTTPTEEKLNPNAVIMPTAAWTIKNTDEEKIKDTNIIENENKESQSEQNDFIVTRNITTNSTDLDENINTIEEKNEQKTNEGINKNIDKQPDEKQQGNILYDANTNSFAIKKSSSDYVENGSKIGNQGLTEDELNRLKKDFGIGNYNSKKTESEQIETFDINTDNDEKKLNEVQENTIVTNENLEKKYNGVNDKQTNYDINELRREYLGDKDNISKEYKNNDSNDDYINELRENAKELEIDKKSKRKVSKEKKQGRIKRFFINIKEHLNSKKASELRKELEEQEQKGGWTK